MGARDASVKYKLRVRSKGTSNVANLVSGNIQGLTFLLYEVKLNKMIWLPLLFVLNLKYVVVEGAIGVQDA